MYPPYMAVVYTNCFYKSVANLELILPRFVLVLMPLVCVNQQSDLRGLLAGSLTYLILFCVSKICKSNLVNVLKSEGNCMWKNVNELWKSVKRFAYITCNDCSLLSIIPSQNINVSLFLPKNQTKFF